MGRTRYNSTPSFPTNQFNYVYGIPDIGYITGPPVPASITVSASSTTGNYTVSRASSTGATGYDLEEDTVNSFTNPTQVYSGSNTSYNVTGKTTGTYYYRVRAANGAGQSAWTTDMTGCTVTLAPPTSPSFLTVPVTRPWAPRPSAPTTARSPSRSRPNR
jgi:hypothetical protein